MRIVRLLLLSLIMAGVLFAVWAIPVAWHRSRANAALLEALRDHDVATPTPPPHFPEGADPNLRGEHARSGWELLLEIAAFRGQDAQVAQLLDRGVDVNCGWHFGMTPLSRAAAQARVSTVKLLLQRGADARDANDSPLMMMVTEGETWSSRHRPEYRKIARMLLDAGADVNVVGEYASQDASHDDEKEWTPLQFACDDSDPELVQLYLARGANPNLFNPLRRAKKRGNKRIIRMLLAVGARNEDDWAVYRRLKATDIRKERLP